MTDGGLLVPDLLSYNRAANLEMAYILWHQFPSYHWAQIENNSVSNGSIKDILAISQISSNTPTFLLLSLSNLISKWHKHVLQNKWLYISRDEIPVTNLQILIPHLSLTAQLYWR